MAQNEKKRMSSPGKDNIPGGDQISQHLETDRQNARAGNHSIPGHNDSNDRGISSMSVDRKAGMNAGKSGTAKKKDGMDPNKTNIPH